MLNFETPNAEISKPEVKGLKIVGKIDLPVTEKKLDFRPEKYLAPLKDLLKNQSTEVNSEYGDLLSEESKIKMAGSYRGENQAIHKVEDRLLGEDQRQVEKIAARFAAKDNLDFEAWRAKREVGAPEMAEMAVTALLHKFMGQDFIVARASEYDDYLNGVDTVLIDKKTGAVICGFDEVLGSFGDNGGDIKRLKIQEKMERGGSALHFGATIEDGVLKRRSLEKLPTFYLSLSKEELMKLLVDLTSEQEEAGESSRKIFVKFINLIREQIKNDKRLDLDQRLKSNLFSSEQMFDQLN